MPEVMKSKMARIEALYINGTVLLYKYKQIQQAGKVSKIPDGTNEKF
jgi:hypothetical protein